MKKEVFIAIIIGFVIGLMITFGVYTAQRSLNNAQPKENIQDNSLLLTPKVSPPSSQNLTLSNPENGDLINEAKVSITGNTTPLALIAITGAKDYTTVAADDQGNFSGEISLIEGANQLTIKSFDNFGGESQEDLTVIFIPKDIPKEASASPTLKSKSI